MNLSKIQSTKDIVKIYNLPNINDIINVRITKSTTCGFYGIVNVGSYDVFLPEYNIPNNMEIDIDKVYIAKVSNIQKSIDFSINYEYYIDISLFVTEEEARKKRDIQLKCSYSIEFMELFNITEESTFEEIKNQYKKLILLHHPDKNINSDIKLFYKIQEYYELFSKLNI